MSVLSRGFLDRISLHCASLADYSVCTVKTILLWHIFFRNQRCQDYPAVPALRAVPLKTAKPLSNVPVMPQCLLHQKKRASGPFPSMTRMAPVGPTARSRLTMQATTITPATATVMINQRKAAIPISDQLSTGWRLCLFCESCVAPVSPPQRQVRRRQGRSVHQAARAPPRPRCR